VRTGRIRRRDAVGHGDKGACAEHHHRVERARLRESEFMGVIHFNLFAIFIKPVYVLSFSRSVADESFE
jgi:hypothetical protein